MFRAVTTAFILLATTPSSPAGEWQEVVARVDGMELVRREVEMSIDRHRPERPSNPGDRGSRDLLERAVRDAAGRMALRAMAADAGLLGDPSYGAFRSEWQGENERRRNASLAGEVVYGPIEFSEEAYYDYQASRLASGLKETLAAREDLASEDLLRAAYDSLRPALFMMPDTLTLLAVGVPAGSPIDRAALAAEMRDGAAAAALASKFGCSVRATGTGDGFLMSFGEEGDGPGAAVASLRPGGVSGWLLNGDTLYAFRCDARAPGGSRAFGEVRAIVRDRVLDAALRASVRERVDRAAIEINGPVFEEMAGELEAVITTRGE